MYAAASAEGAGAPGGEGAPQDGPAGAAQDDDVIDAEVVDDDESQDKK